MTSARQAQSRDMTRFSPPFLPAKQVATGQKVNGKKKVNIQESSLHDLDQAPTHLGSRHDREQSAQSFTSADASSVCCSVAFLVSRFSLIPRPAAAFRAVEALTAPVRQQRIVKSTVRILAISYLGTIFHRVSPPDFVCASTLRCASGVIILLPTASRVR
jgi:hypothetical protein